MRAIPRGFMHVGDTSALPRVDRLRRAAVSDVEQLCRLEAAAFTDYYEAHRFTARQFRRYLADPRTVAYVVTCSRHVVGYSLGVQQAGRLAHVSRLHSIGVEPGERGRGVGRRLLRVFLAASKKRGCRVAVLEVATCNGPAIHLFGQHGFRHWKALPDHYGHGVDGSRMRLQL
jgi:ribosomal protein S18 acetylase RimI-like enzyme